MRRHRSMVLVRTASLGVVAALAAMLPAGPAAALPGPGQVAAPSGAGAAAGARASLPAGWTAVSDDQGLHLVWTPRSRVPLSDARVEVRADGRSLGPGVVAADGRTVTVDVARAPADLTSLRVVAAGRRLDAPAVAATGARAAAAEDEPELPAVAVDPGLAGRYPVTVGEYTGPGLAVPGLPAKVELQAVVVAPTAGAGAPPGDRPLVLLLHGRHGTCYRGGSAGDESGAWPCPAGWQPVPSYRGYLETQRLLASQGYVTVSISANGVNGQDFAEADGGARARSVLVRAHLQRWAGWSGSRRSTAPAVVRAVAPADLDRVLLVGHSRGGEGVNRAALDSTTGPAVPWRIRGQLLIAPTAFGGNPAPGIPAAVLLPYCDGDVFDLQGQLYVDAGRDLTADPVLRSALLVRGANHNYFNSEWTPGSAQAPAQDDWFDDTNPVCGSRAAGSPRPRLTAAEQRRVGSSYAAAAAAVMLGGDRVALGALDGSGLRLPSAGRARVSSHALGGLRRPLVLPGNGVTLTSTGAVSSRTCIQNDQLNPDRACIPVFLGGGGDFPVIAPHLLGSAGVPGEPQRRFSQVSWDAARGRADLTLAAPVSVAGDESLALRVFTEPGAPTAHFQVRVGDAAGRSVLLSDPLLRGLADAQGFGKAWAREIRVPLGALAGSGVDPRRITRLSIVPVSSAGKLWLVDAWGWRPGLSRATAPVLPRVDVGRVAVAEGDAGARTVSVPVRVSGPAGGGQVVAVVQDVRGAGEQATASVLTLKPGTRSLQIPFRVTGNVRDDEPVGRFLVTLEPYRGLAVGAFSGALTVLDDDASPTLRVTPVAGSVTEGQVLTWRVSLSVPSNRDVFGWFDLRRPASGRTELLTDDVPAGWLQQQGVDPPSRPVRLSALGLSVSYDIPPGSTSALVTVPTRVDSRTEGPEHVLLRLSAAFGLDAPPVGSGHDGTVTD